jgi:hypothetical protein
MTLRAKRESKDARDLGNRIRDEVLGDVARLSSEIEKSFFIKKISDMTGISENALWMDVAKVMPKEVAMSFSPIPKTQSSRGEKIIRKLFSLYFNAHEEERIKGKLLEIIGEEKFEQYVKEFGDKKVELSFEAEVFTEDRPEESLEEMFQNLEEEYLGERMNEIGSKIKLFEKEGREEDAHELAKEYQNLAKKSADIKNSRHIHKF